MANIYISSYYYWGLIQRREGKNALGQPYALSPTNIKVRRNAVGLSLQEAANSVENMIHNTLQGTSTTTVSGRRGSGENASGKKRQR